MPSKIRSVFCDKAFVGVADLDKAKALISCKGCEVQLLFAPKDTRFLYPELVFEMNRESFRAARELVDMMDFVHYLGDCGNKRSVLMVVASLLRCF